MVEHSQGAKSGIQIGDKLVGVNGEPIPGDLSGGFIKMQIVDIKSIQCGYLKYSSYYSSSLQLT